MAKRKNSKSPSKQAQASDSSNGGNQDKPRESWRDTLESVVFAFVLAFLFRTFEAEAFVIPTGSMAPTLRGRHRECECERCGYPIVIGASDEVDSDTGYLKGRVGADGTLIGGVEIQTAVCPNCRFENRDMHDHRPFNGDRILVNKYPYEFGDPDRFDVFVFKWPEQPETNYIKRLVGLPNETIRIRQGDLYRYDENQDPVEQILRKDDPGKQAVLQIPVYDDSYYPATGALAQIWPSRWSGMIQSDAGGGLAGWADDASSWGVDDESEGRRVYRQEPTDELAWLRYRNYVPSPEDWDRAEAGRNVVPQAQLITDFCGYNAYTASGGVPRVDELDFGPFWVPDLTVSFDVEIEEVAGDGELLIELVEGVYRYRCRLNLSTGQAELFHLHVGHGEEDERNLLTAECPIDGPGEYEVRFANVDDRLCLWVDGDLVDFGPGAAYQRMALDNNLPTDADLTPVGIAVRGAEARISGLLLERDIYYRAEVPDRRDNGEPTDHVERHALQRELARRIGDPQAWAEVYSEGMDYDTVDLVIGPDRYLAMGDNSPRSSDSRLWSGEQTVPREFLVGKAFYIYWPHGEPFLNGGRGYAPSLLNHKAYQSDGTVVRVDGYPKYTFPFYPQIGRMERIR